MAVFGVHTATDSTHQSKKKEDAPDAVAAVHKESPMTDPKSFPATKGDGSPTKPLPVDTKPDGSAAQPFEIHGSEHPSTGQKNDGSSNVGAPKGDGNHPATALKDDSNHAATAPKGDSNHAATAPKGDSGGTSAGQKHDNSPPPKSESASSNTSTPSQQDTYDGGGRIRRTDDGHTANTDTTPGTYSRAENKSDGSVSDRFKNSLNGEITTSSTKPNGESHTETRPSENAKPSYEANTDAKGGLKPSKTYDSTGKAVNETANDSKGSASTTRDASGNTTTSFKDNKSGDTNFQRWGADGSKFETGTKADGSSYREHMDAKGNLDSFGSRSAKGESSYFGHNPDGGTNYNQNDGKGNRAQDAWNKDGSHTQTGQSANGEHFSRTDSADGKSSQFTDSRGTSNYSYNADGSKTEHFTPADGSGKGSYTMTSNKDGSGNYSDKTHGSTMWGGKDTGGSQWVSNNGKEQMTTNKDGTGSFSNQNVKEGWNSNHVTTGENLQDHSKFENHADAKGNMITSKVSDQNGSTVTGSKLAANGPYVEHYDNQDRMTSKTDLQGGHTNYTYKDGQQIGEHFDKPTITSVPYEPKATAAPGSAPSPAPVH